MSVAAMRRHHQMAAGWNLMGRILSPEGGLIQAVDILPLEAGAKGPEGPPWILLAVPSVGTALHWVTLPHGILKMHGKKR